MSDTKQLAARLGTQAAAEEQGIATTGDRAPSILGWINAKTTLTEIAKALPHGMDAARFARMVQTELRKNPALLEANPSIFILQVLTIAQLGLELGPLGQAYITGPYNIKGEKQTVLVIGYKGLTELAYRSETVDLVEGVTVRAGEPFKITKGSEPQLFHEMKLELSEAEPVAYYAIAVPKGGGRTVFDVMTPAEVEKIRKRAPSAKAASSPWTTDYEPMAQKTVVRRLLNRGKVRLSPQVQRAIAEDEERELGLDKAMLLDPALAPLQKPAIEVVGEEIKLEQASAETQEAIKEMARQGAAEAATTNAADAHAVGAIDVTSEPVVCQICGAVEDADGRLKHDQPKHTAWAEARRAQNAAQSSTGAPTGVPASDATSQSQPSKSLSSDPGAAFRGRGGNE
jgi:recombination protein RecT